MPSKQVWKNGRWTTEPLAEADFDLLTSIELGGNPIFHDDNATPSYSTDIQNQLPSDYSKLRKMYGEAIAEQIEIDDDLAHAGDY